MAVRRFATTQTIARLAAALVAAGGLLAGLAAVHPASAQPQRPRADCSMPPDEISLNSAEQSLLISINTFRQQNGRAALSPDATLNKAAVWASYDDIWLGQAPADHIDSYGRNIEARLRACGYTTYTYIAENNYWGYGSNEFTGPEAAMNFWTNSPPHRANLLDARAKFIGIGRACDGNRCFYTLDFGSDAGPAGAGGGGTGMGSGTGMGGGAGTGGTGSGMGSGTGTGTGTGAGGLGSQRCAALARSALAMQGPETRPVLQIGSQGAVVEELQRLLTECGYPVTVDGDFGPQTEAAVKAFQTDKSLVVDGVVGPQTWGALLQSPAGTDTGTGMGTGGAMSRPVLQFGSQGQAVRELQMLLGQHGYPVTVDGDFGPQTAAAVRAFQKAKGLVVDGVVGPQTWGALLQPPAPGLRAPEGIGQ